jgi:hypothetical protein
MRRPYGALLIAVVVCAAAPAAAQSRVEVSGGPTWTGGSDAGSRDALLSRGTPGTPLTLFATSSRVEPAAGVTARATYFVTSRIAVEALAEYSRPVLQTTISNDFEQASGTEASDRLSSYVFGGSLLYRIGRGRVVPFVVGGAGYLRQLDEDQIMLVSGSEVHAGGGITVDLATHFALRTDAVASSRNKSIGFADKRRVVPVISATLAYRF